MKYICPFCQREHSSIIGQKTHSRHCLSNPNRVISCRKGIAGVNQFTKYENQKPIVSQETKDKMRISNTGKIQSIETRNKISNSMLQVAIEKPESYSGRYNRGTVKNYIVGSFTVIGSWERDFVIYCMDNNIQILQPTIPFSYEFEGKTRSYYPDFYIPSMDLYVEIKGMMTEKDKAKWYQFSKRLIVLKQKEIDAIRNNTFCLVNRTGLEPATSEL